MPNIPNILKMVDEDIADHYGELTKVWESSGHSKYSLAHLFNFSSLTSMIAFGNLKEYHDPFIYFSVMGTLDAVANIMSKRSQDSKNLSDKTATTEINYVFDNMLGPYIRPLVLITGIALLGKGTVELVNYLATNDQEALRRGLCDFSQGYTLAGVGSSMYVRNSKPKTLNRRPHWKKAYELV